MSESGKVETWTRQGSSRATTLRGTLVLSTCWARKVAYVTTVQLESDTRQPGPSVPNLLYDVGGPFPSLGLRFFLYKKGKGAVGQDGPQDRSNGNRSQPPSPSRMRDFQYGFITMSFVNKLWWENANCSAIIAWWASSNGSLKRTDWNYFGFRNSFVLIFLQSLFSVEGVSEGELLDQGGWFWPVLHLLWVFNQQLFTKCLLPVRQPFWFLGYNRQRWLPYWSLHSGEN